MIREYYTKKKLQKKAKYLSKTYWKTNQHLILDTMEIRDKDSCALDVLYLDEKGETHFLFEIWNYNAYKTLEYKADNETLIETFTGDEYLYRPYYFDSIFFLRKYTGITEEDIIKCFKYFKCNILKDNRLWHIFNIEVKKQKEIK